LRYQPSNTEGANPTVSSIVAGASGSSSSGNQGGGGGSGISTGAIAAIATVIPLVMVIGALALFLLWRRRKKNSKALLASKHLGHEKDNYPLRSVDDSANRTTPAHQVTPKGNAAAYHAVPSQNPHETPEWNVEMDATEAERQKFASSASVYGNPMPGASVRHGSEAAELAGMARVPRKPIAPVEIDGHAVIPEVGDAYIPYRPR
jgi:hypothetical protein